MINAVTAIAGISQSRLDETAFTKSGAAQTASGVSFSDMLKSTAAKTVASIKNSESTAMNAMQEGAGLQEVVTATIRAELAVETAVSVRNKMIEAYQEIMRMQI